MRTAQHIALLAVTALSAAIVWADGPTTAPAARVDNPLCAAWAKQKTGSSASWTADAKGPNVLCLKARIFGGLIVTRASGPCGRPWRISDI